MQRSLIMAPDVLRELGGADEANAMLSAVAGPFRCVTCGNLGRFGSNDPTSVVIVMVRDGGQLNRRIQFAHAGCSDSTIRVVRAVKPAHQYKALPGAAWLRPADTDPPAVFVIARSTPEPETGERAAEHAAEEQRDPTDTFVSRLIDHGFAVLSDPDTPLPHVLGLTAWHTPGRLAIHDRYGEIVWDGRLPSSHAWTYAALRAGRLGVVVASGVRLAGQDQARALYTAITGGRAAGAAIGLADPAAVSTRKVPRQRQRLFREYAAGAA